MKRFSSLTLAVALLLSVIHIPTVSAQTEWIVDDGESDFHLNNTDYWAPNYTYMGGNNGDISFEWGLSSASSAQWLFDLPAGEYTVSATWPSQSYFSTDATYTVLSGTQTTSKVVNQRKAPSTDNWEPLGNTITHAGGTLVVTLKYGPKKDGYLAADAVKVEAVDGETPAPYITLPYEVSHAGGEGEGGGDEEVPPYDIDLMVLYTPEAVSAAGGVTQIDTFTHALVDDSLNGLNAIFDNSGVNARVHLVYTQTIDHHDTFGHSPDLAFLENDTYVQQLRNAHDADIIFLMKGNLQDDDLCGKARSFGKKQLLTGKIEDVRQDYYQHRVLYNKVATEGAYATGYYNCAGWETPRNFNFAHEIGHIFGADHGVGDEDDADRLYPDAVAYVEEYGDYELNTVTMNPNCEKGKNPNGKICARIPIFSTAKKTIYLTDLDYEWTPGVADVYENADTMNEMARIVQDLRGVPLAVADFGLGSVQTGEQINKTVGATGGAGDLTWSLVSSNLPTTVKLSSDGRITGIANHSGTFTFTVKATDVKGDTSTGTYTLTVYGDDLFTNPINCLDVNGDGLVAPIDVLLINNYMNSVGSGPITANNKDAILAKGFLDVNNDGYIAPSDSLTVINALNSNATCPSS